MKIVLSIIEYGINVTVESEQARAGDILRHLKPITLAFMLADDSVPEQHHLAIRSMLFDLVGKEDAAKYIKSAFLMYTSTFQERGKSI